MGNIRPMRVIQFLNGKTASTFTSDADLREGYKTDELAGKARIVWNGANESEWIELGQFARLDAKTLVYTETVKAPRKR